MIDTVESDTRVPIAIPLALIGIFSIAQLILGTDPLIMVLCVTAITAPLLPLHFYGRDLYSMIALVFSLRYTGVALVAKTFYGQNLQTNLFDPYATFALTALLMIVMTMLLMLARALDRGTTIFPIPMDLRSLRRLALISFCIGVVGMIISGASKSSETGALNGGIIMVVAANLGNFCYLGVIAEVIYGIKESNGRGFITPLLVLMLTSTLILVIALNMRGFLLSSLIGAVTTAFLYKVLRLRHLLIGLVVAAFFGAFLSPLTLYLRMAKEGLALPQFVELARNTVVKAIANPGYLKQISSEVRASEFHDIKKETGGDYYGDRSNVLNRLSFIVLLDDVYNGARSLKPLGMGALQQSFARNAPGFLGYDKDATRFGMGDWLSWQIGLSEPGLIAFLNFGLPMEGLVTWGWIGFVAYPFIFIFPLLFICGRLSSLRLRLPLSIFIFTNVQTALIEDTSDGLLALLTRGLPLLALSFFMLYKFFFTPSAQAKSASATFPN